MDILKDNKILLIIILLVIGFLYIYLSSSTITQDSSVITVTDMTTGEEEMLQILTDLKTIRLDTKLFQNDAYINLQDFSREIMPEPIGRQDPFAPIENISPINQNDLTSQILLR